MASSGISRAGPLAGDYQGVAQVMAMFGKLRELSGGTIQHGLHDVLASNDHVVVLATLRAQRAGKQLQDNVVHVMHGDGRWHLVVMTGAAWLDSQATRPGPVAGAFRAGP